MNFSIAHLRDVLCVDTVYGVADVLLGRHDKGEGKHAGGGDAVVKSEHPAVDVDVRDVQKPPELSEDLQHDGGFESDAFKVTLLSFFFSPRLHCFGRIITVTAHPAIPKVIIWLNFSHHLS